MKAVFMVAITKPGGGIKFVKKETEINFVPVAGMQVEDSVWDNPVNVVSVCYGIESDDLFITLEKHEAKNSQDQESLLKMYRDHGWETRGFE
jgi:hypothetical protein